jgi:hypothetical protein
VINQYDRDVNPRNNPHSESWDELVKQTKDGTKWVWDSDRGAYVRPDTLAGTNGNTGSGSGRGGGGGGLPFMPGGSTAPAAATTAGTTTGTTAATAGGSAMGSYAPSAIQAGGQIGAAYMGGKGADKAAQTALQGNREALAFQREQEAGRRADYEKANTAYQAKWDAWNANRMALLNRYGVDIGSSPAPSLPAAGAAGASGAAAGVGRPASPGTPNRLMASATPQGIQPNATLGDLMQGPATIEDVNTRLGSLWNQGRT